MVQARRRFARQTRGRRSAGTWGRAIDLLPVTTAVRAVQASFSLTTAGIAETLRRVRGWVSVESDQQGTTEAYLGAMGIAVVSDTALATGITALPGPFTDLNDDIWLFWIGLGGAIIVDSAVGTRNDPQWFHQIDNKAMRRIEVGQSVVVMVENAQSTGITFRTALSLYATRS